MHLHTKPMVIQSTYSQTMVIQSKHLLIKPIVIQSKYILLKQMVIQYKHLLKSIVINIYSR